MWTLLLFLADAQIRAAPADGCDMCTKNVFIIFISSKADGNSTTQVSWYIEKTRISSANKENI